MKVSIDELKEVLYKIAVKYVTDEEAKYFSDEISESYIRKYPRSNVLRDEVLADTERQEKYKDNEIKIIKELPGSIHIDFNHLPPTFKIKWVHDLLIEKAKINGIAILGFSNSGGFHTLHTWSQGLAKRGYFALGSYNGGPLGVVPLNGTKGLLGTNPLTFAFPNAENNTVVDMATSEIPYFEIVGAKKNNQKLKVNTAVDSEGNITTDPTKAMDDQGVSNLLPMGNNYKGYALNYLMEVMTGALVGAMMSDKQDPNYVNEDHGGFLIVIDPNAFSTTDNFKAEVTDLNNVIKSQKSAEGKTIIIPGDSNFERFEETLTQGSIEVDDEIWNKVKKLSN